MFDFFSGFTTDRGDIRPENQDSVLSVIRNGERSAALFAVADGMGGLSYGAQVSRYITEQFERWWNEDFTQLISDNLDSEENIRELMEQEIWDINREIYDFKNQMRCRSGSTLSLLLLYGDQYYIQNIGDSRIYLLRDGRLHQLTADQSVAARMVREHRMTEEEARYSREQSILTMCIGMFEVPQSGYLNGELREGDCFLICSDGLYRQLPTENLKWILSGREDAQEKADRLRGMIEPGLARDNVTAVVAQVTCSGIR